MGIDAVALRLEYIPEYRDTGFLTEDGAARLVDRFASFGLSIGLANLSIEHLWDIYFDRSGVTAAIDRLKSFVRTLGSVGINLVGIKPNSGQYLPPKRTPGKTTEAGRGGYERRGIDMHLAADEMDAPLGEVAEQEVWDGYYRLLDAVLPTAEQAGVRLTHHGNDPPVPVYRGLPHVLRNFDAFERLFERYPSPFHGMTYCVGTRYESGEDVFEGIRRFGTEGRIFHVHFRNVHGTFADGGRFVETFYDDGDLDMLAVARALQAVGYEGILNIDHIPTTVGDSADWKTGSAWLIGYAKALLACIETI